MGLRPPRVSSSESVYLVAVSNTMGMRRSQGSAFEFMREVRLYGGIPGLIIIHIIYGLPITTLSFRNFYIWDICRSCFRLKA